MNRGDVYKVEIALPNRTGVAGSVRLAKYVVCLQGGSNFAQAGEVAVLIASTLRPPGRPARPFELIVDATDGFRHETVIDCRWPYTLEKSRVVAGEYLTRLSFNRMQQINLCLVHGLNMC